MLIQTFYDVQPNTRVNMVEVTEYMKRLGITQEVFQKWQEEDPPYDPGKFQTHGDTLILEQRQTESAARAEALIKRNGNGHQNGREETREVSSAEAARAG